MSLFEKRKKEIAERTERMPDEMKAVMESNPGKYYVYVRPGFIAYFDKLEDAQGMASLYGAEVKEC